MKVGISLRYNDITMLPLSIVFKLRSKFRINYATLRKVRESFETLRCWSLNFHELHRHLRSRTIVLTFPNDFQISVDSFHVATIHIRGKFFPITFHRNRNREKKKTMRSFSYAIITSNHLSINHLLLVYIDTIIHE